MGSLPSRLVRHGAPWFGSIGLGWCASNRGSGCRTTPIPCGRLTSRDRPRGTRLPSGYIEGAPDLAEVVSPSDNAADAQHKVGECLHAGAQRAWVVWPAERAVTVHRPGGSAQTYGADARLSSDDAGVAVEGFVLPVGDIFA